MAKDQHGGRPALTSLPTDAPGLTAALRPNPDTGIPADFLLSVVMPVYNGARHLQAA